MSAARPLARPLAVTAKSIVVPAGAHVLASEALALGLASLRDRAGPTVGDLVDACVLIADLRLECGLDLVPAAGRSPERSAAMALAKGLVAVVAGSGDPSPRQRTDAEALLASVRAQGFDLAQWRQ